MIKAENLTNLAFPEVVNSVSSTQSILTQTTQEIAAIQEQVKCLSNKLEASQQTSQQQQILIKNLTAQLESSQERVAQIERECFLIQARYNEQSHQLLQTENTCQELRIRLTRQQRQTLQFKVALEKCLDVPVGNYQSQADTDVPLFTTKSLGDLRNASCSPPFLANAQPIPPWSEQPQSLTSKLDSTWDSPQAPTPSPTWVESSASFLTSVEWSTEYLSTPAAEELLVVTETSDISEAESAHWQDLVCLLEAVEAAAANSPDNLEKVATVISPDSVSNNELQLTESPKLEPSSFTPDINYPSAVVYPLRPPKGRKSLAEIELPHFSE